MKKILFTICLAALLGILLVSCDDSGTQTGSVPTLTVTSAIIVASDGGEQFVTCSVTDPREDGELYLSADVSWISDFNVIDETVSFKVAENTSDQLRSGNITVLYGYSGGSVSKKVGVVQNSVSDPTLSVQPAAVTVDFIGGKCSFTYSVTNAVSNGELSCKADAGWVGDFDYSTYGTVGFSVDDNVDGEFRSCEITVTYSYSGSSVSRTVTVAQGADDSDSEWDGTLDGLIGTYRISAQKGYYIDDDHNSVKDTTWVLRIYENPDDETTVILDGIVPSVAGRYPTYDTYIVVAHLDEQNRLVVPAQFTGYYNTTNDGYLGYIPCIDYIFDTTKNTGTFKYNPDGGDCTFTYDSSNETWTSDYGMFFGLFSDSEDISSMFGYFEVLVPNISIRRRSASTDAVSVTPLDVQPAAAPSAAGSPEDAPLIRSGF